MESVHATEVLSIIGRVLLFAIRNEGDGNLQRAFEDTS